jgi:hypothetical protein
MMCRPVSGFQKDDRRFPRQIAVGVKRHIDGTVGGGYFQKSGHIEGSLNFAVFALGDDGLPCD